jgi:hypothetical protein
MRLNAIRVAYKAVRKHLLIMFVLWIYLSTFVLSFEKIKSTRPEQNRRANSLVMCRFLIIAGS